MYSVPLEMSDKHLIRCALYNWNLCIGDQLQRFLVEYSRALQNGHNGTLVEYSHVDEYNCEWVLSGSFAILNTCIWFCRAAHVWMKTTANAFFLANFLQPINRCGTGVRKNTKKALTVPRRNRRGRGGVRGGGGFRLCSAGVS